MPVHESTYLWLTVRDGYPCRASQAAGTLPKSRNWRFLRRNGGFSRSGGGQKSVVYTTVVDGRPLRRWRTKNAAAIRGRTHEGKPGGLADR